MGSLVILGATRDWGEEQGGRSIVKWLIWLVRSMVYGVHDFHFCRFSCGGLLYDYVGLYSVLDLPTRNSFRAPLAIAPNSPPESGPAQKPAQSSNQPIPLLG
jgi:hypothetical protein